MAKSFSLGVVMATTKGTVSSKLISAGVESLCFDLENPRFPGLTDQRAALHAFCSGLYAKKTVLLAESIAEAGLNPSELLIVIPTERPRKYTVLEGNRRLAALKLLSNPARIAETPYSAAFKSRLRKAASYFKDLDAAKPSCRLMPTREIANYWISLKHTGENEGVGVVKWEGEEAARFRGSSPTLKLLDYVRNNAKLTAEAIEGMSRFPVTNLERLLADPAARKAIAIEIQGGDVYVTHALDEVLKGLTKIIEDIARGKITVTDIKLKKHRSDYIEKIRSHLPSGVALSSPISLDDAGMGSTDSGVGNQAASKRGAQSRRLPPTRERKTVVPRGCTIEIMLPKVNEVYNELQRLKVNDFPNAASALLRIFIDTTTLEYVNKFHLQVSTNQQGQSEIKGRIEAAIQDFATRSGETELAKTAKNALLQPHGAIRIELLHMQVHGRFEHPIPDNLRLGWDMIEGWMKGMRIELKGLAKP